MIQVRLTKEDLTRARKEGLWITVTDHRVFLWDDLVLNFLQAKDLNVFIPHYKFLDAIVGSRKTVKDMRIRVSMIAGEREVKNEGEYFRPPTDNDWDAFQAWVDQECVIDEQE